MNTKKALLLGFCIVAALCCLLLPQATAQQPTSAAYDLEIDVKPQTEGGAYSCRLTVKQAGEILAAPRVRVEAGSEGQARSTNPSTGEVVDLTVVPGADALTYTVEIRSAGGLLLTRHKARVQI
jgi:hypothetical protein